MYLYDLFRSAEAAESLWGDYVAYCQSANKHPDANHWLAGCIYHYALQRGIGGSAFRVAYIAMLHAWKTDPRTKETLPHSEDAEGLEWFFHEGPPIAHDLLSQAQEIVYQLVVHEGYRRIGAIQNYTKLRLVDWRSYERPVIEKPKGHKDPFMTRDEGEETDKPEVVDSVVCDKWDPLAEIKQHEIETNGEYERDLVDLPPGRVKAKYGHCHSTIRNHKSQLKHKRSAPFTPIGSLRGIKPLKHDSNGSHLKRARLECEYADDIRLFDLYQRHELDEIARIVNRPVSHVRERLQDIANRIAEM